MPRWRTCSARLMLLGSGTPPSPHNFPTGVGPGQVSTDWRLHHGEPRSPSPRGFRGRQDKPRRIWESYASARAGGGSFVIDSTPKGKTAAETRLHHKTSAAASTNGHIHNTTQPSRGNIRPPCRSPTQIRIHSGDPRGPRAPAWSACAIDVVGERYSAVPA